MAINSWADADLCNDADCVKEESRILDWNDNQGLARYRALAKEKIGIRLAAILRNEKVLMDLEVDESVLDHIYSYDPLKTPVVHLTIYLLCKDKIMNPGDLYDEKSRDHYRLYQEEFNTAVDSLSLDFDESGTLEASEQFNIHRRVSLKRGG